MTTHEAAALVVKTLTRSRKALGVAIGGCQAATPLRPYARDLDAAYSTLRRIERDLARFATERR